MLSAVILAGLASLAILGPYTYFGVSHATAAFPGDAPLVIACGVGGGALGAGFSVAMLRLTGRVRRWRATHPGRNPAGARRRLRPPRRGQGSSAAASTFGTGYDQARSAIEGAPLPAGFFAAKFLASLASALSGISGGLFAPALSIGAGLGSSIGLALGSNIGLAAVLGMAGYFSSVVQAPMTAFVIILEMTGNHDNVIPLMLPRCSATAPPGSSPRTRSTTHSRG